MTADKDALVKRLQHAIGLLTVATNQTEVRGIASVLHDAIAALTAQPSAGEPVAHGFESAVNEYRINKKLSEDKESIDFLINHLLALADKYHTVNQLYTQEKKRNSPAESSPASSRRAC